MSLSFCNTNTLWASVAVETLVRLGLKTAVLCPGSRSTPLTVAFAAHERVEAVPILDERSAAFFALGCAKRQHQPVALVCTSGTAGANFYPAVIEAWESGVPLMVFTADRPPELLNCGAGQAIDQQQLFGAFVKQFVQVALPQPTVEMLAYWRQTLVVNWQRAIAPTPGPIHFNCPFRDPLPPLPDGSTDAVKSNPIWSEDTFFQSVAPPGEITIAAKTVPIEDWQHCERGLIIAGPASPVNASRYCQAVATLSQSLGWPVLAEGISPLRHHHYLNNQLISTYDGILREPKRAASLIPQQVIQLGSLPISKVLRQWLSQHHPRRWVIGDLRNVDPVYGPVTQIISTVEQIAEILDSGSSPSEKKSDYLVEWLSYEKKLSGQISSALAKGSVLVESKIVWLLSQFLPQKTPLFIANSMPVRDVEYFWPLNNHRIQPMFSRGANGIDGTLSTAMGIAHRNLPAVLLTGDLAFLHDTNGLLNVSQLQGSLTVIVVNNQGGGIFEMLPISKFDAVFEDYFVMPQSVNLASLCKAYGIEHYQVHDAQMFSGLVQALPVKGVRVIEVACDRAQSTAQRKALLSQLSQILP